MLGVTFVVNVPMNEALATAVGDAAALWRGYTPRWTAWNHVRTAAATLAFLVLIGAAVSRR